MSREEMVLNALLGIWAFYCVLQFIRNTILEKKVIARDYAARVVICTASYIVGWNVAHYITGFLFIGCTLMGVGMLIMKVLPNMYKLIGFGGIDVKSSMYNKDIIYSLLRAALYFTLWILMIRRL